MLGKSLKRGSANHDQSIAIKQAVVTRILSGKMQSFEDCREIRRIKTENINADIKQTNLIVGLTIEYLNKENNAFTKRLFVKKTTTDDFLKEKEAIETLNSLSLNNFRAIHYPFNFITEHNLVVSRLLAGKNEKLSLRRCYVKFYRHKQKQLLLDRIAEYSKWLSEFHACSTALTGTNVVDENKIFHKNTIMNYLFPAKIQLHNSISNKEILDEIKVSLLIEFKKSKACYIHGDFGLQNIMHAERQFHVIDWEKFHFGWPLEDCISFIVNILTQCRHVPFDLGFTKRCIESFTKTYFKPGSGEVDYSGLVVLLAVNNVIKRHEWTGEKFSSVYSVFYLPLLRQLFNQSFNHWAKQSTANLKKSETN